MTITDEQLTAIESRCNGAEPGVWETVPFFLQARTDIRALLAEVRRLRPMGVAFYTMKDGRTACGACHEAMDYHHEDDCPSGESHWWCYNCGNLGELSL